MKNSMHRWQTPALRYWLPVALLLGGFGLRVYRLGNKSVWWDEGWTAWVARQSMASIARQTGADVHPPLYFWLLHLWQLGSGDSEFALRFFSAVMGLLTVAATYLLGRTVGGGSTGLLAALFVAISRFDIAWSQEMRMYALAALLAALAFQATIRVWDRGRPVDWALYIVIMAAGLYTLYLFFPVPVAANVAWLGVFRHAADRRRALAKWALAQVSVLALLAPWLVYALDGFLTGSAATPVAPVDFLKIYWTALTIGIPLEVENYSRLTLPVLGIFVAGLAVLLAGARHNRRQGRNMALFIIGLAVPIVVVYLVSLPKQNFYAPPFSPRYLVIYAAYYSVLLAWGIGQLGAGRRWPLAAVSTAVVVYVALFGLRSYYPGRILVDDYKSLAATLAAYERPNDAVVLYTDRDWPIFAYHHPAFWWGVPHLWTIDAATAESYLSPIWQEHDGVWLVITPYAGVSDPQGEMPAWLAARATAVITYPYGDKALHFYARTPERAATAYDLAAGVRPRYTVEAMAAPEVQLVGYDQVTRDYRNGDIVHLFLYWDTNGAAVASSAEVGLIDGQGHAWKWQRIDAPHGETAPTDGLARQQIDLTIPADAHTDEYTFYLFNNQGATVRFGRMWLRHRQMEALTPADVTISQRLDVDFGAGIRLLGYDVAQAENLQPGDAVHLTLYWQAQAPVEQRYKVFTHLLGAVYNATTDNFLWGQQDNEPVNNTRPMPTWPTGQVIVDSYAIPIDAQAPAGTYRLEIGLYDPVTGQRLMVVDEAETDMADHLILGTVTVDGE